jgi:hypothetical protein
MAKRKSEIPFSREYLLYKFTEMRLIAELGRNPTPTEIWTLIGDEAAEKRRAKRDATPKADARSSILATGKRHPSGEKC